jgi:general L-amino acid transport system permease protein
VLRVPSAPRTAPAGQARLLAWRRRLAPTPTQAVLSLVLLALLAWASLAFLDWAVLHAVWQPDADRCQAARGTGACWGVVAEKWRLVLLGRYPMDASWRPVAGSVAVVAGVAAALGLGHRNPWALAAWPAGLILFVVLVGGGFGLSPVATELWGGLPLTLFLTSATMALAFPLAIALALGRRSAMPVVRAACTVLIELVRGVPLVPVLFIASFVFPLLLSPGRSPDLLVRVVVALAVFAAAYMAEVIRGGLQAVPRGQVEAAASIGLGWWQAQRRIVLPQALRAAVPALTNNALSLLKETSLVTIVSLYELTGTLSLALASDPVWRPFKIEAFLVVGAIYFVLCFALARASARLEHAEVRA